ncbi:peptidoglycan hydrolase-like protein with peptidoglycan-binding domain [Amycolatopsis bartoniae]|uniref:Peptidoglycan binding-like domain-containing protein n=1 Tax=Amycolatopsis bartoniae TaxID=941986 RepID=A0A8H9MCX1_9PSEU|nr:peptidoglycan-binding protein [Amycolatopsis bartoniae]MBB2935201.1 peptidoglycan hydrolase-like protein with peptidoglycan-binding domain [Amycolatopsis bartoniae]TVT04087.1 peptidoglycan-binding protein [Amycolatopsis bartoniae]GHF75077.1 hypothetical protein GCM10017566_56190 [Amycolatopsis bartoniae]
MSRVEVWATGLECRVRQESEDEIYGSVQVGSADRQPHPALKFPDSGYLRMGPDGQRIHTMQALLYSGPPQDLGLVATLAEFDSGDVEQEKQVLADAAAAAITTALAAYTAGLGAAAAPLIDLLARGLVNFGAGVLGISNDIYNPQAAALPADALLQADSRRRTLTRPDDPRSLAWTDVIILSGRDDGGDYGEYGLYLDVRVSAPTPAETSAQAEENAAGTPTLRRGSAGPAVRKLQRLLNARLTDLVPIAVDGQFGPATEGRAREFQSRTGLVVDGIVGPRTWAALTGQAPDPGTAQAEENAAGTPTLRRGSAGPAVRKLQRLLNARMPELTPIAVDGQFGPATDARVREFQRRAALAVDGVVGPNTWRALGQ